MKRNIISTLAEIFFPIILMAIILAIRQAFSIERYYFSSQEKNSESYISKQSIGIDTIENSLLKKPIFQICSMMNGKREPRFYIADLGIPEDVKRKMVEKSREQKAEIKFELTMESFKPFKDIDELNDYVGDSLYGQNDDYPLLCFGIKFEQTNSKYNFSLHFFDSTFDDGIQDIPTAKKGFKDYFQSGPDFDAFKNYRDSGYMWVLKTIYEHIIYSETGSQSSIEFSIIPMKYTNYREDPFGIFIGYIVPFFIIIAYMCPLCIYVYRMVGEKETKVKEGMKIMGLSEGIYFLSYFIQYTAIGLFDSLVNTVIISYVLKHIPFHFLFFTFFLWCLSLFALVFFFQSFIDKTRVALILSLLIYFVMYFLSMSCMSEDAAQSLKIILCLFPPVCIELGIVLMGKFESHFRYFHNSFFTQTYTNYSIGIMYLMLIVDFFLYLFLGYYLQNVISHEFGISKPWYFLCTKSYWFGNKSEFEEENKAKMEISEKIKDEENDIINNVNNNIDSENNNANKNESSIRKMRRKSSAKVDNFLLKELYTGNPNFQSEELYKDRTSVSDALRVRGLVKIFEDGKKAVDNVDINFYKNQIFALLGHNGAGKTTIISMLTGMYEASNGKAYYDGVNILEGNNMDNFRAKLGICPQHDVLFNDLNIREHLSMFSTFKGLDSDKIEEEVDKIIKDFELENMQNIIAKNLSAGQRRKLSIAISLIGGSKVIFLDEPSSGMDITSRRSLWEILKRQCDNKIIILTTHYMEEASVLGNRIGIINAGQMKCIGSPLFLIERFGKFMSLNIKKDSGANDSEIIEFVNSKAKKAEYEVLSEEIMFRIPKSNYSKKEGSKNNQEKSKKLFLSQNSHDKEDENKNKNNGKKSEDTNENSESNSFDLIKFFEGIDNHMNDLKIKSYSASMPTLEDVFLNVAQEDNKRLNLKVKRPSNLDIENDKILFETEFREDYTKKI